MKKEKEEQVKVISLNYRKKNENKFIQTKGMNEKVGTLRREK